MATAFSALVSLFNNLELIQNHPCHSFSFENKQIQSLLESVRFLIDFMESCDYHSGSKEAAEFLEWRIASAAHAADDIVESQVVDQIHAGSTTLVGSRRPRFLLDLQKAIEDMEFVRRKAIKVKEQSGFKADEQLTYSAAATSSTPLTSQKNTMVGFVDDLNQLMDVLTGAPSSLEVTSIVGMGGIGKTTLARNAYKHALIVLHFDVRLWVTISQQYSLKEILLQLLPDKRNSIGETDSDLGYELHKMLWGRRYLIILDDIWSVEAWNEIQLLLPDSGNSSRVVLTTRQWNVVDYIGSGYLEMDFLDEDESWDLFCQKAFANQVCPPELEDIGKKIVEKCDGLPLAINVVGGHLGKSSRMQGYWENIANDMSSILNSGDNEHCLDILSLSYTYLPVHLKPCFLYMGTFPEDKDISLSNLIKLWIAEGFLKSSEGAQNMEEVAEDYLEDLIDRNLILVNDEWNDDEWNDDEIESTCMIHDLLRELCLKIAEKEKFFSVLDSSSRAIDRERRVVIHGKFPEIFDAPRSATLIRSLTCEGGELSFELRLLKVVNGVEIASLVDEADGGVLKANLRYICCQVTSTSIFVYLPSSISMLWSLQTLIFEGLGCKKIIAPYEIWEMPQLRHLKCDEIDLPDPLPNDRFEQPNQLVLRSIKKVVNLRLSEEVCKRIPHIKELELEYREFNCSLQYRSFVSLCDEPRSHYSPHNLGRLHELETLNCIFHYVLELRDFSFPDSLKELTLSNLYVDWDEFTMRVGSLPHLEVLDLKAIGTGAEWNLVEGGFPRLKSLSIRGLIGWMADDSFYLSNWIADSSCFPVLEKLSIEDLPNLNMLPSVFGEIPTLERIVLHTCSVCLAITGMRILVEQEDSGNDSLHLEVILRCDEDLETFNKTCQEEGLRSPNLNLKYWHTLEKDETGSRAVLMPSSSCA